MIFKPEIIAVLSVVTSPAPHLAETQNRDSPNPFHPAQIRLNIQKAAAVQLNSQKLYFYTNVTAVSSAPPFNGRGLYSEGEQSVCREQWPVAELAGLQQLCI